MVLALFLFFFLVVVLALFLFFFLVVMFELHAGGEANGLDVVSHMKYRRARFFHRFEGVTQAFFEVETVGHDHDGAFHSAPILQRGLEGMGVAARRNEGDHFGLPIASHVGHYVSPD